MNSNRSILSDISGCQGSEESLQNLIDFDDLHKDGINASSLNT